jgi:hypothetical protein
LRAWTTRRFGRPCSRGWLRAARLRARPAVRIIQSSTATRTRRSTPMSRHAGACGWSSWPAARAGSTASSTSCGLPGCSRGLSATLAAAVAGSRRHRRQDPRQPAQRSRRGPRRSGSRRRRGPRAAEARHRHPERSSARHRRARHRRVSLPARGRGTVRRGWYVREGNGGWAMPVVCDFSFLAICSLFFFFFFFFFFVMIEAPARLNLKCKFPPQQARSAGTRCAGARGPRRARPRPTHAQRSLRAAPLAITLQDAADGLFAPA